MRILPLRQATIALLASTSLIAPATFGAEYTVSTPTIVQNGGAGNIVDGGDKLTIETGGSITTAGDAISTTGGTNTIINNGSLTATGFGGYGISTFGNGNIIANSGTINITGQNGGGVGFFDGTTFTNSGSVRTTNNNAEAISGFNNNTINNSGSVSTSGQAVAIQLRDNNTVNNSGSVATSDTFSNGIFVRDSNIVNNSGTITTANHHSNALIGQNNNTLNNSGTITTTSNNSAGMSGLNNNTFTSSGTITTSGDEAIGIILLGTNNTATNSGTITVNGDNTYGFAAAGTNNTLTNSGTIIHNGIGVGMGAWPGGNNLILNNSGDITTNGNAHGIVALNDSTINNTGTILTKGTQGRGILGAIGNTVNHSGKVVAIQTDSFLFTGSDNQLNLLAPAFIGGTINMGTFNAVSITTGRSHSNSWYFSGTPTSVGISGPVPWAWDAATQHFATIDPTALSAAPDMLANITDALSDLTRLDHGDEWWLRGYGNFSSAPANGIYNDYIALNGGIATGASFMLNDYVDLGAFVGYQASNLSVNSRWVTSQTLRGNGVVGGIYGTARHENIFADFALYAGWSGNNSDRFVNDNLQPLGEDHALANYNSWFLAPELRVGMDIATDGVWTLTPSATARFSNQWVDGYTETGSNANATIGARQVQVFEGEIELAATRALDNGSVTLAGGFDYRQTLGGTTQNVTLLGQNLALPMNTGGTFGAFVGLDGTYDISEALSLDLSAKAGYVAGGGINIGGSIGVSGAF